MDEAELRQLFCDADQGHVFGFWEELTAEERKILLAQLGAIDLPQMMDLIETHLASSKRPVPPIEGVPPVFGATTSRDPERDVRAREQGEEALRQGRVAVLMVAGGQASRFAYEGPKGTFPITPVTGKSLFCLQAEKVLALRLRYDCTLPLLVQISPHNGPATRAFFEEHQYFGLPKEDVFFFEQGMLPAVDRDGRLLLAKRGRIFLSPDGHGGVFRGLRRAGLFEPLTDRGIDTLFYFHVDNPLVRVADPVFLGTHLLEEAEVSLKVVRKRTPDERVGLLVQVEGSAGVVEYSDAPAEIREERTEEGELRYWAGNIGIHLFSLEFMRKVADGERRLPYHMTRKRVPYVDRRGEHQQPGEPNCLKFESFVFDSLPLTDRVVAWEVSREEEFAPVKNRHGEDSPETAIRAQSALFRRWLATAGIQLADENALVEIGPLFALDEASLVDKVRRESLHGARRVLLD